MHAAHPYIKILIVDDDEDDFLITREYLNQIPGRKFNIDWCSNYQEALDQICTGQYDLYFVDYLLGPKTGLELIRNATNNNCEAPIILLTGKGNQEVDIRAMQAGAVDYLVKIELSVEKLERCIRYALDKTASMKALRSSEKKFRSFFEKSKDAVFFADINLVLKDINLAMAIFFEYPPQELCEMSLYQLLHSREDELLISEQLEMENEINDRELEFQTKSGERKNCILSVSKEKDDHGHFYVQGIIHDISSLKKAERANIQVEKLGATARLVRILAHEIRNPLNNIYLSLEQLTDEQIEESSKIFLEIIHRNSRLINGLITDLLDASKSTEIPLTDVAIQSVIEKALANAKDRIQLKRIQVLHDFPEQLTLIKADAEKLKIAFLNIIINAVEAMEEGKGRLHISVKEQGEEWQVTIRDNGCGIEDEALGKLFEPYFTSKKNGLGLGLASTLSILQAHKATIDVETKPGSGTAFKMTFKKAGGGFFTFQEKKQTGEIADKV
jgi:PAS domain S-box-containing protein